MVTQVGGQLFGVLTVAFHTQAQGFQTLQDLKGIHRADSCAGVTQWYYPATANVGSRPKGLGIHHTMIGRIRLIQHGKTLFIGSPVKLTAVHNDAAHAGTVAAYVLGETVHYNICAKFKGATQNRGSNGVINDHRHTMFMSNFGQFLNIHHVTGGVTDRLTKNGFGVFINGFVEAIVIVVRDHFYLHALARQRMGKQVIGTTVKLTGTHNIATNFTDGLQCVGDGCHTRGQCQRTNTTFHCRHAFFQYRRCGVHDAGINVARHLKIK